MIIAVSGNRERKGMDEVISALETLAPAAVLVMSAHLQQACLNYQARTSTPVLVWSPGQPDSQQHSYVRALKALRVDLVLLFGTGRNAEALRKAAEKVGVEVHEA